MAAHGRTQWLQSEASQNMKHAREQPERSAAWSVCGWRDHVKRGHHRRFGFTPEPYAHAGTACRAMGMQARMPDTNGRLAIARDTHPCAPRPPPCVHPWDRLRPRAPRRRRDSGPWPAQTTPVGRPARARWSVQSPLGARAGCCSSCCCPRTHSCWRQGLRARRPSGERERKRKGGYVE